MNQITPLVKNIIIINVIVFLSVSYLFPSWMSYFMAYYPTSANFHPIQIVTHMFMHGSLIPHLFFNMFMLYMFGSALEYIWGEKYLLFVYLLSGFGAIALHYLVKYMAIKYYSTEITPEMYSTILREGSEIIRGGQNYIGKMGEINILINTLINTPAVGASGATMGILAAFGYQYPRRQLMLIFPPIALEARIFIPLLILMELFMGIGAHDNVAHFAHIGGAITGFLLARFRYKINI